MKRNRLVRVQIVLLVLLALLVVARVIIGSPPPKGLVVMVDLDAFELEHKAFKLQQPAEIAVAGVGSYDTKAVPAALAAYGWIVRRADREVVWTMEARTASGGQGTLAHSPADTLILQPGIYDAYFSSYGATYDASRGTWRRDADDWQLVIRLVDETVPAWVLEDDHVDAVGKDDPGVLWRAAPLRSDREQYYLFRVTQPATLDLYAVGEIADRRPADHAWIENVITGEKVWAMTLSNTEPAGGLARNRRFRGALTLDPGTYRAVARTNERHDFRKWRGNPPFDPAAWGLTLYTDEPNAIAAFDPWLDLTPLISFTEVPDDAERSRRFRVLAPTDVVLYGVGEITGRDEHSVYDFGELLNEETGERLWKMSYDASSPAGGDKKNRVEVALLRLPPGTYRLRYETDDSHAYDDWNRPEPYYPKRWGVSLFPMNPAQAARTLRIVPDTPCPAAGDPPLPGTDLGEPVVDWNRLGPNFEWRSDFALGEGMQLYIRALGEIGREDPYDYGWIENADTGETVWKMTLDNTCHAGGTERNRIYDAVVRLPAGRYVAHFRTDGTHHYEAFDDDDAPPNPHHWGMKIYRLAEEDLWEEEAMEEALEEASAEVEAAVEESGEE